MNKNSSEHRRDIEVVPFSNGQIKEAAELFSAQFERLRKEIPALPDVMLNPDRLKPDLEWIITRGMGLAAVEDGRLVGFICWIHIDGFRDTTKAAAYIPDWAHSTAIGKEEVVYPLLIRKAAAQWQEKQYPIWGMTCLANNLFLETYLYRNGFGMIVQDAVHPIHIPVRKQHDSVKIRKCSRQDIDIITALEKEHGSHYSCAPILMSPRENETPESIAEFMAENNNSYWLAEIDGKPQGFMRFESVSHGAAKIVRSEKTIAITAAFVKPVSRGRGAAYAILQQALADYEKKGYTTCSVDYETINPEAYSFWTKYFRPVCFSVVRYPEKYQ